MWPLAVHFLRRYAIPAVAFPVALVIGTLGYGLERLLPPAKPLPTSASVMELRDARLSSGESAAVLPLKEATATASVLSRNLSPSLQRP